MLGILDVEKKILDIGKGGVSSEYYVGVVRLASRDFGEAEE